MKSSGPEDLRAIGDPIAAELLPGWRIEWGWCEPEAIGGALAMIYPDAKREMARIMVAPHPEGEDIGESIAHEIGHGLVRPLVDMIPEKDSAAQVLVEEQIVERLGVFIARLWKQAQGLARASLRRGVATYAPADGVRFRIRISAGRRPQGRQRMDAKEVLAAITGQDEAKALQILTAWAAEQIQKSTGQPGEAGPESNPEPPMNKDPNKPEPADPLAAPPGGGDMRARMARAVTEMEQLLARQRAATVESEAGATMARKGAKELLIEQLRARLPEGHKGLAAIEKRILGAGDIGAAKMIFDLAIEMAPEPEPADARSRGGDRLTAAPKLGTKPQIVKPADFDKFDPAFQSWWLGVAEHEGQEAADALLVPARARLSRDSAQGRN